MAYTMSNFTSPNAGVVVSNAGNETSTTAADGQAIQNIDQNAVKNPMSASGDIIYGGASGTPTRLPKGSDTQVLTLASGVPVWAAVSLSLTDSTVDVVTSETTTSVSYTDLSTSGPAVTLSPGVTLKHLLLFKAYAANSVAGSGSFMSIAIAGAGAVDADAAWLFEPVAADGVVVSSHILAASQSSGATHTAKYKVGGNTGTFQYRRLTGIAGL